MTQLFPQNALMGGQTFGSYTPPSYVTPMPSPEQFLPPGMIQPDMGTVGFKSGMMPPMSYTPPNYVTPMPSPQPFLPLGMTPPDTGTVGSGSRMVPPAPPYYVTPMPSPEPFLPPNMRGNSGPMGQQNIPMNVLSQRGFLDQLSNLQRQIAQWRTQFAIGSPERQDYRAYMQSVAPMFRAARENFSQTGVQQMPNLPMSPFMPRPLTQPGLLG